MSGPHFGGNPHTNPTRERGRQAKADPLLPVALVFCVQPEREPLCWAFLDHVAKWLERSGDALIGRQTRNYTGVSQPPVQEVIRMSRRAYRATRVNDVSWEQLARGKESLGVSLGATCVRSLRRLSLDGWTVRASLLGEEPEGDTSVGCPRHADQGGARGVGGHGAIRDIRRRVTAGAGRQGDRGPAGHGNAAQGWRRCSTASPRNTTARMPRP